MRDVRDVVDGMVSSIWGAKLEESESASVWREGVLEYGRAEPDVHLIGTFNPPRVILGKHDPETPQVY